MAGSVNKAIIIGNLGRDPEVRTFPNSGSKYCNLNVATSERWKDRNTGENRERTEWHRVTIYVESTARFAEQYLQKGMKVYIEGQIETRKWQDQSGQDRYSTEITVRPYSGRLEILDRSSEGGYRSSDSAPPISDSQMAGGDQSQAIDSDDIDDEIPF